MFDVGTFSHVIVVADILNMTADCPRAAAILNTLYSKANSFCWSCHMRKMSTYSPHLSLPRRREEFKIFKFFVTHVWNESLIEAMTSRQSGQ